LTTLLFPAPAGVPTKAEIAAVDAWTILDSRGRPTLRVRVRCANGIEAVGDAPAGASRGSNEAAELRDAGVRWMGLGVEHAIAAAQGELAAAIRGRDACDQGSVDDALREIDGTPTLSRLGGNAIVAISVAVARCGAASLGIPLYKHLAFQPPIKPPVPLMNVLNGGAHANGGLRLQECMIVPHGPSTVAERVRCGAEVYAALRGLLTKYRLPTTIGDEGGFVIQNGGVDGALTMLSQAIDVAGYRPGTDVSLAIDAAANGFYDGEAYQPESGHLMRSGAMVDWWQALLDRHPIIMLEDPLAESDEAGWQLLTARVGDRVRIVGDDIFVTDAERIRLAAAQKIVNSALIKPNQVGTVSGALDAIAAAQDALYEVVISHRSGETCDTLVADLAWATGAGYLKAGAPARSERTAKYNRLIEIERELA
jgi:enolase